MSRPELKVPVVQSDIAEPFPTSGADEVGVCCWNLLAPSLHENRPGRPTGPLDWQTLRLPALRSCLQRLAACDVFCLQEVETARTLADLKDAFTMHGFEVVVQEKKQHKGGFHMVNATFFRTSRLRLAYAQHRNRALITGLELSDGRVISITNVHLEAGDPHKVSQADRDANRKNQLESVLRRSGKRAPWCSLICGDFNDASLSEEGSPLRKVLEESGLQPTPDGGATFVMPGRAETLDYVWAGSALQPLAVLHRGSAVRAAIAGGLPSEEQPSDHLPVACLFRLEPLSSLAASFAQVSPAAHGMLSSENVRVWLDLTQQAGVAGLLAIGGRESLRGIPGGRCWADRAELAKLRAQRQRERQFLRGLRQEEADLLCSARGEAVQLARSAVERLVQRCSCKA